MSVEGVEAGPLYVDVVADVTNFGRNLQAKINLAVAKVKADIKATVDATKAEQQLEAIERKRRTADIQAQVDDAKAQATLAALEAKRRVVEIRADADVSAAQAKLDATAAQRRVTEIKVEADTEAAKAKLDATAAQQRTAEIKADLDAAKAEATLAAIAAKQRVVEIKADADTAVAQAKLDRVAAERRKAEIKADADTAAATAKLDAAAHPRRVSLNLDTDALGKAGSMLSGFGTGALGLMQFPAIASGITMAVGAVAQLAAGLGAVAAAAAPAVGVLAALPALVAGMAQGAGSVITGFSGISDAMKASAQADASSAATSAASAAQREAAAARITAAQDRIKQTQAALGNAEAAAARQIQTAQDGLANAHEQAALRVAAAERARTKALDDAKQAEQDLVTARADEIRKLEDLNAQLAGGRLGVEQAQIDVERAGARRDQTNASATSTGLDRHQADLDYREAVQRLQDQQREQKRLEADTAKANAAGVNGAQAVIAARTKLQDANAKALLTEQALRREEVDGPRKVAQAEATLANARRSAAFSVQSAEHQVLLARRDLAAAQASATLGAQKQTAAQSALAAAMGKLSPAGRNFVKFLTGTLRPAWDKVRKATQQALLPPVQRGIKAVLPLLGTLSRGMSGTAAALGKSFEQLATKFLATPLFKRDFQIITGNNTRAAQTFGRGLTPLVQILDDLTVAAGPLVQRFADFVTRSLEAIAAFTRTKRATGELGQFFKLAGDTASTLWGILRDLGTALFNIGKAGYESGQRLLGSFSDAVKKFSDWTGSMKGQNALGDYFKRAEPMMREVGDLIADITKAIFGLGNDPNLAKLVKQIRTQMLPAVARLSQALNASFGPAIVKGLTDLANLIADLADTGSSGGLTSFVVTLDAMVRALDALVKIPGVGQVIGILLTLAGVGAAIALVVGPILTVVSALGTLVTAILWVGRTVMGFIGFLRFLIPVVEALGELFLASGPWGWIILAIAALVIGLTLAYQHSKTFRDIVQGALHAVGAAAVWLWKSAIGPALSGIMGWLSGTGKIVANVFGGFISWITNSGKIAGRVFSAIGTGVGRLADAFGTGIAAIRRLWGGLQGVLAAPLEFMVNTVYNNGIRAIWNRVAGLVHLPTLPTLRVARATSKTATPTAPEHLTSGATKNKPMFARGGVVPGYAPGRDVVHAMVSPGEGWLVPEAVRGLARMLGTSAENAVQMLNSTFTSRVPNTPSGTQGADAPGGPRFATGGVLGWVGRQIGGTAKGAASFVGNRLGDARGALANLVAGALGPALRAAASPLKGLINRVLPAQPPLVGLLGKAATGLVDKAVQTLTRADQSSNGSADPGGSGVQRWAPMVLKALQMVGQPATLLNVVLSRMNRESGGNPRAVNNWDINAQRGDPSRGLMQTIGSTFKAYHFPGTSQDIYDPLANILASMKYAIAQYGSLSTAYNRAGGYDSGGLLQPGDTHVHNGTGKPEVVFTDPQWDLLSKVVASATTNRAQRTRGGAADGLSGATITIAVHPEPGMDTRALAREVAGELGWLMRS